MVTCLPGSKVEDFISCIDWLLVGTGEELVVMAQVGINDIGKQRGEVLEAKFRCQGRRLKSKTSTIAFSKMLSTPCGVLERWAELLTLSAWMR